MARMSLSGPIQLECSPCTPLTACARYALRPHRGHLRPPQNRHCTLSFRSHARTVVPDMARRVPDGARHATTN